MRIRVKKFIKIKIKNKFSEFVGIWKGREITQESIREEAWKAK
jgi:hypothetical protein